VNGNPIGGWVNRFYQAGLVYDPWYATSATPPPGMQLGLANAFFLASGPVQGGLSGLVKLYVCASGVITTDGKCNGDPSPPLGVLGYVSPTNQPGTVALWHYFKSGNNFQGYAAAGRYDAQVFFPGYGFTKNATPVGYVWTSALASTFDLTSFYPSPAASSCTRTMTRPVR
jgi:hypothetical protein